MDIDFSIDFENFQEGFSPLAHLDSKTFLGSRGHASEMKADIISLPGYITQSPALSDLTNGTQAGVVDQLIRFILDKPVSSDTTYAVGTTKLFKLSSTTVTSGGSPSWPQSITGMAEGESIVRIGTNLLIFYNKSSGGDIATLSLSDESIDNDWGSTTDQALEKAPHPSAVKEDIVVFGNGQYAGVFILGSNTLDVQKLDFGVGAEVADVVFHANVWWIAVNYGEGRRGQVYLYDGSAISNILSDEAGVGDQKIGFLYILNGNVYIAYDDLSSDGFAIGLLQGRAIKPLRYFTGTLPTHRQKTLYKNTILFTSSTDIYSLGASVEQLPIQISKLADGGYETLGGIAAPFGTPMIASNDDGGHYRLAKFSGYATDSNWKSIFVDVTDKRRIGNIHTVIVTTKALGANARADITIEGNQGDETSSALEVSGTGTRRKQFTSIDMPAVEDVRVAISYANGNAVNPCQIRKITLLGNFVER